MLWNVINIIGLIISLSGLIVSIIGLTKISNVENKIFNHTNISKDNSKSNAKNNKQIITSGINSDGGDINLKNE